MRLPTDIEAAQLLLNDLQEVLPDRVRRLRLLVEVESREAAGRGLIMPGGLTAHQAYLEAREAFVNGQFIAVVMLGQCLLENLLAGYVYMESLGHEVKSGEPQTREPKPAYRTTVAKCRAAGLLNESDESDLRILADRRNALAHFRDLNEPSNVERRSMSERRPAPEILEEDAADAVALLARVLGKPAFRFSLE